MKQRIESLRELMDQEELDSLLVTNLKNVRYLAGFTGTAGRILITPQSAYFITDFRYDEQAHQQVQDMEVIIYQSGLYPTIQDLLTKDQVQQLGIEALDMTVATYLQLEENFDCQLIPTEGYIESLRAVKDASELATIEAACQITDQVFDHILTYLQPGMREIELANEMERFAKSLGATAMSFDTIVASGYRSAMPHGVASDKVIEIGDMVTFDFGVYYQGYASDITRTIAVGQPDPKLVEIYQIVLEAHNRVIQATRAGLTGAEVDAIARDYITEQGYGDHFGHSTGHGLGLDVHEAPGIHHRNEEPLVVGNVITDEPGIYLEGLGGVRIEDDLIVLEDGVRSLNQSPKDLIILDF